MTIDILFQVRANEYRTRLPSIFPKVKERLVMFELKDGDKKRDLFCIDHGWMDGWMDVYFSHSRFLNSRQRARHTFNRMAEEEQVDHTLSDLDLAFISGIRSAFVEEERAEMCEKKQGRAYIYSRFVRTQARSFSTHTFHLQLG